MEVVNRAFQCTKGFLMDNPAQDPMEVVNKYGADALRLYLINSPVVRAETLKFKEEGVFAVLKDVFLPWYNAYRCARTSSFSLPWCLTPTGSHKVSSLALV
jgi:hypothetical protein